jgi:hypothetical protein
MPAAEVDAIRQRWREAVVRSRGWMRDASADA